MPEKTMRGAVILCLMAVVTSVSAASAALTPIPIEGTILVSSSDPTRGYIYFIEGMSDNTTPAPAMFTRGEISPYMDQVVYSVQDTQPAMAADVWVANVDGSGATSVTGLAGLGGVSCNPAWSPDATQIAFQHADPTSELAPCDAGFQVWVINSDGTGAHQVMADATAPTWNPTWAPNGARLVFAAGGPGAVATNADGTDPVTLPPMDFMDWSPDGTSIAYTTYEEGSVGGEAGLWHRLRVANADGTDSRVLVENFLSDADLAVHLALWESSFPSGGEPANKVYEGMGPSNPKWSPRGNRILFRMAYPFVPDGDVYWNQVELWIYDLDTDELIRITENEVPEWEHSWDGDNTLPEDSEVTVDNVTVNLGEVEEPGTTTIVLESDPPALPDTYLSASDSYVLATTAVATGPAEVSMGYDATAVPDAAEGHLKLLRYDEGTAQWQDITTARDLANHVITGTTSALGLMELSWPLPESDFSDVSDSATDPFWALWEIQAAYDAGIVQGYPNGTYHPAEAVSRAQMAVYISRALAGGDAGVPANPTTVSFPDDVPADHWAYRYVEYAVAEGVVQGYDATHYRPDTIVTRDQMAVFVARAKQWVTIGEAMNTAPELFSDVAAGFWCGTAVQACVTHGVVNGYPDGTYHPERQVTRDQMAVYVARAFDLPY
jgi:hypothetical protein